MPAPVIYLGDSHVRYLKMAAAHHLFAPRAVDGLEIGGATAVGMRNPNSQTDALGQFRDFLRPRKRDAIVILQLGEVDCGFVIWHRATRYGESVETQMDQSIAAYMGFVDEMRAEGFHRVIVTSATLPTISDDDQRTEVARLRSGVKVPQTDRTALTLAYNAALHRAATARGLPFVDVSGDMLDPATGLVRQDLRNPNPTDHHMNYVPAMMIWLRHLDPAIGLLDPWPGRPATLRATGESFVLARALDPMLLGPDMKVAAIRGDRLRASLRAEAGSYVVVSGAVLNEVPLDARFRLIPKAQWEVEVAPFGDA